MSKYYRGKEGKKLVPCGLPGYSTMQALRHPREMRKSGG